MCAVFSQQLNSCIITRSSVIAEGPRDASCQLKSCQLRRNSAETTYSSVGRVFGHQWLSRWLKFRRSRFKSRWKREFLENSKNYLRCDNSSIKETLCSRKPGCRVAQLVESLVTSGYPDGSSSGCPSLATLAREKTGKWKDSHPAVAEHDCPEINSSQRWCLCKKNTHVVWSHGDLGSSRSSISS